MKIINNKSSNSINQDAAIKLFAALGDATRFKLVQILFKQNNICVSELAQKLNISVPGTSQQLKILESAGVVTRRRDCQKICYELQADNKLAGRVITMIKKQGGQHV